MYTMRNLSKEEEIQKLDYETDKENSQQTTYNNLIFLRNGEAIHHVSHIDFAKKVRDMNDINENTKHNLIARSVIVVPHKNIRTIQSFNQNEPHVEVSFYQNHNPSDNLTIWNLTHIEDDRFNTWSVVNLYQYKPTVEQIAEVILHFYETIEDLTSSDKTAIDKLLSADLSNDILDIDQVKIRDSNYILYPVQLK